MNQIRQHRRRRSHKSKNVTTTEEVVLNWALKAGYVCVAIAVAVMMTLMASR